MKTTLYGLAAGLMVLALAGCGGGGESSGSSSTPATTQRTTGTMVKTSANTLSVNGKVFNVGAAAIRVNGAATTAGALRTGMRVVVSGKGGSKDATRVESDAEVRGAVTSVSAGTTPQSFMIGTTKVVVDANTVYDDLSPASFDAIKEGVVVEVDGTRNTAGDIVATRVEGKAPRTGGAGGGEAEDDELRGPVTATGANSITVGTTVVNITATTTFKPAATCSLASITTSSIVEAHGAFDAAGAFTATSIECEDQDEINDDDAAGGENEVEGLVRNPSAADKTFTVDTQAVRYTDTTRFEDGTAADLVADARVEVKGTLDGTTLVATEIEIKAKP